MSQVHEAARAYVERGWHVFPCISHGKEPATRRGFHNATADPDKINGQFRGGANIAIATGSTSGIVVIDIDGDEGAQSLAELERQHGELPTTPEVRTGKGRHLYFRAPDFEVRNSASKIATGIDVRGTGGYVLAPPSVHPSGAFYEWTVSPRDVELAELPEWLAELLRPRRREPSPRQAHVAPEPVTAEHANRYAERALEDELARLRDAKEGERNDQLNRSAFALGQLVAGGALEQGRVIDELHDVAAEIGLEHGEITKTITSGMRSAEDEPRTIPERTDFRRVSTGSAHRHAANDTSNPFTQGDANAWGEDARVFERHRLVYETATQLANAAAKGDQDRITELYDALAETMSSQGDAGIASLAYTPTLEDLTTAPAPRRWLLERPDPETNGTSRVGWLPMGHAGLLAAAGGTGKTMALVQLAVAVATGTAWYGLHVANPGRVLLALAEEDGDEVRRRLYRACRIVGLSDTQYEHVAQHVVCMPLAGHEVSLLESNGRGNVTQTRTYRELREYLETEEWSLVVLDPLARWAGFDVEKDNGIATRALTVVDSLAKVPGEPAVLVAHHSSQVSRSEGDASAVSIRGVTAIVDTARWAATMQAGTVGNVETVTLRSVKANYSPAAAPITLVREDDGMLRVAGEGELDEQRQSAQGERIREVERRIVEAVQEQPGIGVRALRMSLRDLGCSHDRVDAVREELERVGRIRIEKGARNALHHYPGGGA